MDIGISGAASGADPSIAARSSRSSDDSGSNGFADALTNARNNSKAASDDDDRSASNSSDSNSDDGGTDQSAAGKQAGSAAQSSQSSQSTGSTPKVPAALASKVSDLKMRADAKDAAAASTQDAAASDDVPTDPDAQAIAAAVTDDSAVAQAALADLKGAKDAAATALAGKTTGKKGDDTTATTKGSQSDTATDDTKDANSKGAVADALTLLTGPTVPSTQDVAGAFAASGMAPSVQMPTKDSDKTDSTSKNSALDSLADLASGAASTSTQETDATAASTVKVARADGRGATFDLTLSGKQDDLKDLQATVTGGTPDVTVLDSRRFLGLAAGTNSATVLGTIGGNSEWVGAMSPSSALANEAALSSTGKVVNTLKIQLNPENLGSVTATMRLQGDALSVDLKVQSGEAYRQLSADQGHMIDALRSQGYAVDRITVTLSAPQSSDSSSQSGFQGQSQQQAMTNQGQGGEAQGRRQNYAGQADDTDSGRATKDTGADSVSGPVQRSGAGGVYL